MFSVLLKTKTDYIRKYLSVNPKHTVESESFIYTILYGIIRIVRRDVANC